MSNSGVLACPHCRLPLLCGDKGATCASGHNFDRSRDGYLNLMVGGRLRSSSTPGDTADSLDARRRFLASGAYQPLSDALVDVIGGDAGAVFDVGCGEGYYLSQMPHQQRFGLDISKRAVQLAQRSLPDAEIVVASSYRMPVLDDSCSAVYSVFAPHSLEEFSRVLRPGGVWVTITPGPGHLEEMRPRKKESVIDREQKRNEPPPWAVDAQRLRFALSLTDELAGDLFTMTPLRWQTASDSRPATDVSVDVWVSMGRAT